MPATIKLIGRFTSVFFILLIGSLSTQAQQDSKIETLKRELNQLTDTSRVEMLLELAVEFERLSSDSMIWYAEKAKTLSIALEYDVGQFTALSHIGNAWADIGDFSKALDFFKNALALSEKIGDKKIQSNAFNRLGSIYRSLEDYPTAIDYYIKCLQIREEIGDTRGISVASGNIGYAYLKFGEEEEAEKYFDKMIEMALVLKDTIPIINGYLNFGLLYENSERYQQAIAAYEEGIRLAYLINDEYGLGIMFGNLGNVHSVLGDFDKSIEYLDKSFKIKEQGGRAVSIAYTEFHYQRSYFRAGKYNESIAKGKQILKMLENYPYSELSINALEYLEKAYVEKDNLPLAYKYRTEHDLIQDSIFNAEKSQQVSRLRTLYETEKSDRKIDEQEVEIQLLATTNTFQQRLTIAIASALLLAFGLIYFYRSNKFSLKSQKLQELFSQKLLGYQEEERQRISRDLHDSIGQSLVLIKNKVQLKKDEETSSLIAKTLEEVQLLSKQLHPVLLEKLGLTKSMTKLAEDLDNSTDIFVDSEIADVDGLFPIDQQLHIYRIMQEAISNMVKHADTVSARVSIEKSEKTITCSVIDRGKGFDLVEEPEKFQSLGMQTLKERTKILQGKLLIDSTKGKGTSIILSIDIPKAK